MSRANNKGGAPIKARTAKHNWELFDALPREVKEIFWATTNKLTPGKGHWSSSDVPYLRQWIGTRRLESTRQTYGMDHPQAHASKQAHDLWLLEQKLLQSAGIFFTQSRS